MPTPTDVLQASLEKHNATFEALLNLIPAKYYLVQQLSEEQASSSCGSTLTYQRFNTGLDDRLLRSTRRTARNKRHLSKLSKRLPRKPNVTRFARPIEKVV